ncbi:MAG: hypothetical protein OCC45_07860 [Desulfotalea sp.]
MEMAEVNSAATGLSESSSEAQTSADDLRNLSSNLESLVQEFKI